MRRDSRITIRRKKRIKRLIAKMGIYDLAVPASLDDEARLAAEPGRGGPGGPGARRASALGQDEGAHVRGPARSRSLPATARVQPEDDRSEERRVWKECRSRWSPYH